MDQEREEELQYLVQATIQDAASRIRTSVSREEWGEEVSVISGGMVNVDITGFDDVSDIADYLPREVMVPVEVMKRPIGRPFAVPCEVDMVFVLGGVSGVMAYYEVEL